MNQDEHKPDQPASEPTQPEVEQRPEPIRNIVRKPQTKAEQTTPTWRRIDTRPSW